MQRESVPSRYAALFKKMEDDKKGAATREADTPQDNRITAPQASPSTSRNLETFLMSSSTLSAQQDPDTGAWSMLSEYGADETSPQIQPSLPLSRAFMQNPKTGAWPVEVQKHGAPADIATPTTFKNTSRDELKLTCNPSQAPDLFDNMDESQDYKTTASFADAEDISPPVPIDEDEDIAALSTNNAEFFSPVKLSSQTFNTPSTALNLVNRTTSSKPHLQAPPLASSSSTPTKVQRDDDDEPLIKIRLAERKAREEEKSPRSLVRKLEVLASDGRGEAFWNGDDGKAMPQPGGPTQREKKKATRSSASWGKASSKAKNNGTASLMSTTNRDTVAPQPTHVQDVSALKKGKQRLPVAPTTPSAASTSFEGVQGPSQHAIPEVQMPVIAVPDNGNVSPVPSQHPNAGQESKSSVAAMLTNDLAPPKAPPATVGQQADSTTTTNDPCEQYFSELLPRLHQLAQKAGRPVDASHITDKRSDTLLLQLKPLEGTIERPWILELGHGYFVEILSDIDKLAQDLGKPVKVLRVFQWGTKVPQLLVRAVGEGGAGWFFGGEEAAGGTFGTGATASKQAELETVFVKDECASRGPDWTITTISKQVKDKVASTKSPSTASCTSPDTEALASTNKTSHTSKSGLGGSFKTGLPMQDVSNACGKAKEQKPTPETAGKQPSSSPVQTPVSHSLLNIAKEKGLYIPPHNRRQEQGHPY